MIIKTGRFGSLEVAQDEIISIPQGVLGFPESTRYCLIDPGDEILILWLQSLEQPDLAFPVLEPRIFKPDYAVRLSGAELRELKLESINSAAVFNILTITQDISEMSANLRAPVVINLVERIAKQVVLQENEYGIKHSMFKELRTHLITIASNQKNAVQKPEQKGVVQISKLVPSPAVKALHIN